MEAYTCPVLCIHPAGVEDADLTTMCVWHERAAHSINVAADIAGAGDKVASLVLCWAVSSMAGRLLAAHEISTRTYLDFRG